MALAYAAMILAKVLSSWMIRMLGRLVMLVMFEISAIDWFMS